MASRGRTGRGGGRSRSRPRVASDPGDGTASRRLAIEALRRIEEKGAYANLVLPPLLERSSLSAVDRRFVTELVYGTTRMKRACDYLYDRFLIGPIDHQVRAALRVGTYQLCFLGTPAHAAVDATVGAVTGRGRSIVNAVLRKVAGAPVEFPDPATELSYPDWIVDRFEAFLGSERAGQALRAMNRPAQTMVREDGYVQDAASQLVVAAVEAGPDETVIDLCAAPGGKATAMAAEGARVVAVDRRPSRVRLIAQNCRRLGLTIPLVAADGRSPPFKPGSADRVLVDAPCSGFGSFRRRADARWRIEPEAPARLAQLQFDLVRAGCRLLRPGGRLIYSICTLTPEEGPGVVERVLEAEPGLRLEPPLAAPWVAVGPVSVLIPAETDGMMLARLTRMED